MSGDMSLAAAGCAFYATLAIFPALTTLISLYGLVFDPQSVTPQLHYLQQFMPYTAYSLIAGRIKHLVSGGSTNLGIGLAISLAFTLYSSSSGTKSLIYALNLIHRRDETRGFVRFQATALGMTLLAIIGAILAIGVLVVLPLLFNLVGLGADSANLVVLLGFVVLALFMALALSLLYRFGPSFRLAEGHAVVPGAVVAIILWMVMSYLFALYVGRFAAYSQTYGPLATIIGLMMWFYLTAYALLFGAQLNAAVERARQGAEPLAGAADDSGAPLG
ncbi:MAG TPA: YihY/virulence factor BrkB family protein [Acidiphilium sp.]|nr:YihY/virulence factor BrkB family protein [Acidiphilium sp.]HQU23094.1 YihY/virulence factor BrkB family protein [Acidiphilium sp.]